MGRRDSLKETLLWYHGAATWIRFKQRRPVSDPNAESYFVEAGMFFINNETLKINSGADVPCHDLPNIVHKGKDWQANMFSLELALQSWTQVTLDWASDRYE